MRLQAVLDKLEAGLPIPRRTRGRFCWFVFSKRQIPFTEIMPTNVVYRDAFLMLLTITFYLAAFFFLVPLIAEIFVFIHFRHHFHHIPWHFIRIIYRLGFNHLWNEGTPVDHVLTLLMVAGMSLAFQFALRWAWNRRANRLNSEVSLPQLAPTVAPGVWPPPPIVSVADDAKPK